LAASSLFLGDDVFCWPGAETFIRAIFWTREGQGHMFPHIALVLEDNLECRFLLTEILKDRHLQVQAYSDPGNYLTTRDKRACQEGCPCLGFIMTDNHMPGMSGLEFLEILETEGCKMPRERKAIISGDWTPPERERARVLGCQVFSKPYNIAEIYAWLETYSEEDVRA
jgi:CheY-like chemotaxis protein